MEDLLIVATLLDKYKTAVDLRQELDVLLKEGDEDVDGKRQEESTLAI